MNIITIEPIIKFASADDPLFTEYKTIIGNDHLTPGEALQWLFVKVVIIVEPLSALYYLSEPIKKSNRSQHGSRECALRTVLNGLKFRVQIRALFQIGPSVTPLMWSAWNFFNQ